MAKGKSNPKTVERVKGMTKAMRNEMEQAEAEAAAQAAAAKAAKERRKGRGRGHVSSDEDEPDTLPDLAAAAAKPKSKVQIGGFGIGCRGTGNEKARRLKEEHDAQTRKKKAARLQRQAEAAERAEREDDDDDEAWRVRNPTVNKKANRGKKTRGGKAAGRRDVVDDDDGDVGLVSVLADLPELDEAEADEADDAGGPGTNAGAGGGAARQTAGASSAFALLMGDEDEEEDEEEEEEDDDDARGDAESRLAPGGFAALRADDEADDEDDEEDDEEDDKALGDALAGLDLEDVSVDPDAIPSLAELEAMDGDDKGGAAEGLDPAANPSADSSTPDVDVDVDPASGSESEWETDEDEDENAPWDPRPCESLFDGHVSESVEANETYMRVKHGFVIPYRDSVADLAGLLSHLQRKIYRRRQCVWCSRKFSTLEGVRGHMRDAGHVKIKFEPASVYRGDPLFSNVPELDDYVPELSEFYDFPTGADAVASAATFDSHLGGLELVLGSGKQLGHRSYRRYYRQKFRNDYVAKGSKSDERRAGLVAVATRLATRERNKQMNAVATRSMRVARGGASKALAAQYAHKAGFADNAARRAIVHHWGAGGGGSHYHTAGSKQFLKGVRIKGVVSRHSKQGARLGAARVQAARNKANRGNASVAVLRSSTRKG